ncbi:MAG: MFS transporter [Acidobacteria bacterium]|nr:MFS transporter [Acidobacteriota bacterium]
MRRPWLLVALLSFTAAASYLCRVNVSVTGALMMREFGWSQAQLGRVFSAFLLGYAICQIPAGMLADRFGARRVLAASAFLWVLGTSLLAITGWIAAILAIRFFIGVFESPTFPASAQSISRWIAPERRARANGFVIASIGIGSAAAPPLVSALMVRFGWRTAILTTAIPALVAGCLWLLNQEPAPERRPLNAPPDSPAPHRTGNFLLLTASYTLQGYVGYIFVFWFYLYLVEVRHFSLLRGALLGSLPWLLSIVSIPLGGWLSDHLVSRYGEKWGRRLVPLIAMPAAGVLLSLGARTSIDVVAAVAMAISTALILCVEGPFWATMTRLAGSRSGSAGGAMNMGSNIGGLISPALTPLLAEWVGWEAALHVAALLAIVGGLLWLRIAEDL